MRGGDGVKQRWLPVGLLALAIFVVNALSRFISWKAGVEDANTQSWLGLIGVIVVGLMVMAASIRWSIRYPFPRLFGDMCVAVVTGTLLSVIVGPFAGGQTPFAEGAEFFVYEMLLFIGIGALSALIGFVIVTALGKDWKSRGLKRFEQRYNRRPHRVVRG
jgi:hypothetical protein